MQQYIGFKLDSNEYTIPIMKVLEIINTPSITKLPQSPAYMVGIVNIRGSIIPVIDLKTLIATGSTGIGGSKIIIVSSGRVKFGILVDTITSVINIDESKIETPEDFMHENLEQVQGVARLDDRMVIMLDTNKLIDVSDLDLLDEVVGIKEAGDGKVEVSKVVHTMAGDVTVKELHDATEFLSKRASPGDPKQKFINSVVEIIDRLAAHDYDNVDSLITELLQFSDNKLYSEVGKVTRKLHNAIKEFKNMLDPKLKSLAKDKMPDAVDSLEFVIQKSEEAANKTLGVAEKYSAVAGQLAVHAGKLKGPKASVEYIRSLSQSMGDDMTELMLAQDFQDITGQSIRKVIDLVNSLEEELVKLVTRFGVKVEVEGEVAPKAEKVTQDGVDDILKDLGF